MPKALFLNITKLRLKQYWENTVFFKLCSSVHYSLNSVVMYSILEKVYTMKDWKSLTKGGIMSTIYGLCMTPMTMTELTKIIYDKEQKQVNRTQMIKSINILIKNEFCQKIPKEIYMRNWKIRSEYKPFFLYCQNKSIERSKLSDKKNYNIFSKDEEIIFKSVFDSNWFRSLFSQGQFMRANRGITRNNLNFSKGRLEIYNPLSMLAEILERIGGLTWMLSTLKEVNEVLPKSEDLLKETNFDKFSENKIRLISKKNPELINNLDKILIFSDESLGGYPSGIIFLKHMIDRKYFLCLPYEFSEKLTSIERGQTTYPIAFRNAMSSVENNRKIPEKLLKRFNEGGSLSTFE